MGEVLHVDDPQTIQFSDASQAELAAVELRKERLEAAIREVVNLLNQPEISENSLSSDFVIPPLEELLKQQKQLVRERRKLLKLHGKRNRKAENEAAKGRLALRAAELKIDRDAKRWTSRRLPRR